MCVCERDAPANITRDIEIRSHLIFDAVASQYFSKGVDNGMMIECNLIVAREVLTPSMEHAAFIHHHNFEL